MSIVLSLLKVAVMAAFAAEAEDLSATDVNDHRHEFIRIFNPLLFLAFGFVASRCPPEY